MFFLAFIEDGDLEDEDNCCSFIKEGSWDKETHKIQSETLRKHSYNGIYISPSKYEEKEGSSSVEEISKSEVEESAEVEWEGELISALEELKKS